MATGRTARVFVNSVMRRVRGRRGDVGGVRGCSRGVLGDDWAAAGRVRGAVRLGAEGTASVRVPSSFALSRRRRLTARTAAESATW